MMPFYVQYNDHAGFFFFTFVDSFVLKPISLDNGVASPKILFS